jgi:hypothetical protein
MNISVIATRVAATDYDYDTKARVNAFIIEELARKTGLDYNDVAIGISESDIHRLIDQLSKALFKDKLKLKPEEVQHISTILNQLNTDFKEIIRVAAKRKKPSRSKEHSITHQDPEFSCRVEIDLVADFEGATSKNKLLSKLKSEIQASLEAGMKTTARDLRIELKDVTVRPVKLDCAVDSGISPDEDEW